MGTLDPEQPFARSTACSGRAPAATSRSFLSTGRRGPQIHDVSGSALLCELVDERGSVRAERPGARTALLPSRSELLGLLPGERLTVLTERLRLAVAATLGAKPDAVRVDQPLVDLGSIR